MHKRFKIGGVPEHFNFPFRLAIEENVFKNKGIELHWSDMTGGTGQMIKGLESGSLDIAVLLTEGITRAILKGLKAKIVSVYVDTPLRWGIHVSSKSPINDPELLKDKTFAVSREGSGSHLMTYVKAIESGWNLNNLKFNVVGDIFGGLWALQNNKAEGFLWEKYTTHPYTEEGKCKIIGEVLTPWPCFMIAVREELIKENINEIYLIKDLILSRAQKLKKQGDAAEIFAWRYNLKVDQVSSWLSETNWSETGKVDHSMAKKVVQYLLATGLVDKNESNNWETKIFIKH